MSRPRLLPWSEDGKPAYLSTDNPNSILSRLADEMEETQLGIGREVHAAGRQMLADPGASRSELRFTAIRLAECLFDALRVAESRGERLAANAEDDEDQDTTPGAGQEVRR
ncbi:hypothetical protein AB0L74_00430 [Streptomyces sp. NPDC052020]|uniref:hypothetical protein n=1 Tax=Streptomyces sp. NPDC052020 TaxID=3155677 RepID=UPI0034224786